MPSARLTSGVLMAVLLLLSPPNVARCWLLLLLGSGMFGTEKMGGWAGNITLQRPAPMLVRVHGSGPLRSAAPRLGGA